MINKNGGAIWSSVLIYFLPPFSEEEIKPYMHMDPLSGAPVLLINAEELDSPATITELITPPLVAIGGTPKLQETPTVCVIPTLPSVVRHIKGNRVCTPQLPK
jgi:hypothetical protein